MKELYRELQTPCTARRSTHDIHTMLLAIPPSGLPLCSGPQLHVEGCTESRCVDGDRVWAIWTPRV